MNPGRTSLFLIAVLWAFASLAEAQVSPEEHKKHHPGQAGPPQGTPGPGAMEEMMKGMMGPPSKEIYPSLMELPSLSPEQREQLQKAAHERMQRGTQWMGEGLDALLLASPAGDYQAMQQAVSHLREGLSHFDSGLATHRVIAEGRAPSSIALQWFQTQMNLPSAGSAATEGPLGFSWGHAIAMFFLIAFAAVMIAMYFFKMRRATNLLQRLTTPPAGAVVATAIAAPAIVATPSTSKPTQESPKQRMIPAPSASAEPAIGPWAGSLRVANVFTETPTVKTFRLVNPASGPIPFTFLPGQFLTLAVALAGNTVKRSYTIASSPSQREYVEITVKREELGVVSRYLHERVRSGDLLQVSAAQGRFTFTGSEAESIVLIGGGVGITPLMSILRALTDRGWGKPIYLLYSCRTSEEFVFREELERLQRRHANLHVIATMTRAEGTAWMGPAGRLTRELVLQSVPELPKKRVHLCGPPPMMDAIRALLLDLGVPGEQILTEAFGPAEKRETRQAFVQTAMVEAPAATTATVSFTISGKSAPLPRNTTVLEAAEHVGVSIDNSCRSGTCGSCKVKLLKGAVTMAVEDSLSAEEKARGIILACQAKSSSDLEVEA